jgi:formate hydrogenlyase subunit 3/multisubunit Na+/H+ antiporter MnhD subunit
MLGKLNIASWGFLIGAIGQNWFYTRLFPQISERIILAVLFIPWLTAFVITFCKRPPPISPRAFRICLLGVVGWYAILTILAELLHVLRHLTPSGHFTITTARVLMYIGLVSCIVFTCACVFLQRYERNQVSGGPSS